MGGSLAGAVIAIDPGHGRSDPGIEANGVVEAELAARVATELAAALERRDARPLLLRGSDADLDVEDRVRRANRADAAICVSIHVGDGGLVPAGTVCCYYGTPSTHSPMGLHLATAIASALAALGLPEGGVRPLAITVLRETRMPAVQVELGVATNEDEAKRLLDPAFPGEAARVIAAGMERFLTAGRGAAAPAPG
jgi:N-acetylmuramoyl-L-alanine amidase